PPEKMCRGSYRSSGQHAIDEDPYPGRGLSEAKADVASLRPHSPRAKRRPTWCRLVPILRARSARPSVARGERGTQAVLHRRRGAMGAEPSANVGCGRDVPEPVADQLAATALVFTVVGAKALAVPAIVGALAAVVGVSVRRAPLPEVGAAAAAAPAIAAIGARAPAPEGVERLRPLARGAALGTWHPSYDLLRAGSFSLPYEHGPCHLVHTYGRHVPPRSSARCRRMPRRPITEEALCHIPQGAPLRRHRRPAGARAREGAGIGAGSLRKNHTRRDRYTDVR